MKRAHARSTHHAQLAHHIPGRLRVRFPRENRRSHIMERLKEDLLTQTGIQAVGTNHAAGSVTVSYDPQQHSNTGMLGVPEDLGVIVSTMIDAPHIEVGTREKGPSAAALSLSGALDDLNQRLAAWTGNVIDLLALFPLSLVGVGLWQVRQHGLMLEMPPGWLLVWLGFDAFLKLHAHQGSGERGILPTYKAV